MSVDVKRLRELAESLVALGLPAGAFGRKLPIEATEVIALLDENAMLKAEGDARLGAWQVSIEMGRLRQQLAAMTKARDEACEIADRMIDLNETDDEGWQSNACHVRSSIAELRKVGSR